MIDHAAALRFDAALDRPNASEPGSDLLIAAARTIQELDNRQRGAPSDVFRAQLRQTLLGSTSDMPRISMNGPHTGPFRLLPEKERAPRSGSWNRLLAVVAALVLLIAGAGAVAFGRLSSNSDREPNAIPAVGFATPATPEPESSGIAWIAPSPDIASMQPPPQYAFASGRIFRLFSMRTGWPHIQAVDARDGSVLWDLPTRVSVNAMQASGDLLLVAGQDGESPENDYALVALDARTGREAWRVSLSDEPADMAVAGNRALVLSTDNNLDAIDLETHQVVYVADIGGKALPLSSVPGKPFSTQHRLAVIDGTLGVVLADGSIAGIDIETGTGQWWTVRREPGTGRIYAIGGTFLLVQDREWEGLLATPSGEEATPPPEVSPGPASCLDTLDVFTNEATSPDEVPEDWQLTFYGIDPETGEPGWAGGSTRLQTSEIVYDHGLVFVVVSPYEDRPRNPSQVAFCTVNAADGAIAQIDRLSDLTGETFRLKYTSDTDVDLAVGVLDYGRFLAFPANLEPDIVAPTVDLGADYPLGGFAWIDVFDGDIYLSLQDGRLVKVGIPAA